MTARCLQDPLYNPLLDALEAGHEQIASLLLDHGANVCLRQVCVVVDGHNVGILPGPRCFDQNTWWWMFLWHPVCPGYSYDCLM
jgi:hypothetical protein